MVYFNCARRLGKEWGGGRDQLPSFCEEKVREGRGEEGKKGGGRTKFSCSPHIEDNQGKKEKKKKSRERLLFL